MWLRITIVVLAIAAAYQFTLLAPSSPPAVITRGPLRLGDSLPDFDVVMSPSTKSRGNAASWMSVAGMASTRQCRVVVFFTSECSALPSFTESWGSATGRSVPELWVALESTDSSARSALLALDQEPPLAFSADPNIALRLGVDYVPLAVLLDTKNRIVAFPRSRVVSDSVRSLCEGEASR
jgi:hypothetical protein